jgi:branched-chain amino acid transport system permease protein
MQRIPPSLWALALFLILIGASWSEGLDSYTQLVIMFMGINIIMSASLNLINGYMGEFSCGHAGFMAVGAYVTSILTVWFFTSGSVFGAALLSPGWAVLLFPLLLLAGGLAAALAGLMIAVPSFRTRGDYLAIITLAANYIIKSAIENIQVIGGARGFMGMSRVVNGMEEVLRVPWMMIWIGLCTALSVLLIKRFITSTYG